MRMVIQKIRGMESDLLGVSKQFPSSTPAVRKAVESIRAVLRQIIANPGAPEPEAPSIGG